ncbi:MULTISPECIES: hypothetical protein [unclassified Rhizobium]|uniref:hypothetical protein n=1 Tax=unclassified Rhizobium TaxID=2613769 RepID=UPI0021F78B7F|nr:MULTISPECIES: hypothetical protein [unclassified Rhizobium]MCV9943931.1 hypothetical protein [Rhizobium sp. BT-175]MCW0017494.1 hypothetical protein [Rhizobium sp. BT-226]
MRKRGDRKRAIGTQLDKQQPNIIDFDAKVEYGSFNPIGSSANRLIKASDDGRACAAIFSNILPSRRDYIIGHRQR